MPQKKKKKKKKKILSEIINYDLYFSPTGIRNVLISSKIEKKKKKTRQIIEFRAFLWGCCREKKEREKKTRDRITEVFHFQYVRDFGITINMETKPKWLFTLESLFSLHYVTIKYSPERTGTFVGLFDVLLSIMIYASEQKKVRSFLHDPIIRLRMYQDGDSL